MIRSNNHECSYILIKPKVYLRYYMGVTAAIKIKKYLILDIAWVQQQQQKRKHPIIRTSKPIYSQVILRLSLFIFVFYPYVRPSSEKNIFHCESMLWNFYNCISTITIALFIFKFLTTNTTDLHKVNVLPCSFFFFVTETMFELKRFCIANSIRETLMYEATKDVFKVLWSKTNL